MGKGDICIGIIGALESEIEQTASQMTDVVEELHMGRTYISGRLHGTPIVIVQCGMGKVNAALCACALIEHYHVTCVINTGVAGSLDARINIGDLVISTSAVQHDLDASPIGFELGLVPGMAEVMFPIDDDLRATAKEVAASVAPNVGLFEGVVASGDVFVSSGERKDQIVENFGALCCEMEGAAIAHACYLADVPVVIVRAISDKADGSAHVDFATFTESAAHLSSEIVSEMVNRLGASNA